MRKAKFVHVICLFETKSAWNFPRFIEVYADHTLAEKECAYRNKHYSTNAVPNPEYKPSSCPPWDRMKIKNKKNDAEWFYIKTIRIE